MPKYIIESNVPPPSDRTPHKYPFGRMDTGESFVFFGNRKMADKIASAASHASRRLGRKFTIRKTGETEEGTSIFRCWRIK